MDGRVVRWYPVLFLALLAALTVWIDRTVQAPPPLRDGSTRHDPDFVIDNFSATRMNPDGSERHSIQGSKMTHYPDDNSTHVDVPHFTHYDYATAPVRITAKRGLVSHNGENVFFIGDVRIVRDAYADQASMQLDTEQLQVIPDRDLALTDKPVTMTTGASRVDSVGMEFDNRSRILKLLSKVKVTYASPIGIPGLGR
jgi:lipopolysaccharide export system protein LptC